MRSTLGYIVGQVLWLLASGLQLISAMGLGIMWIFMTMRCCVFATLDLVYFIPNVFWYLLSPTIIRRVSYRSSRKTRLRNLGVLLKKRSGTVTQPPSPQARSPSPGLGSPAEGDGGADAASRLDAMLAAHINPADGSFVNGLPIDIASEFSNGTFFNSNNSFDETVAALQQLYARRLKRDQQQKGIPESPGGVRSEDSLDLSGDGANFTDSESDEDEEDKKNLHNRAFLDIYLPVPLDSLFRFMSQEKRIAHKKRLTRKKFPIVISVNGGAWVVGSHMWNFLVARVFAARGYVVFCPDYRNFPQATMEEMTLDVSDAISWVLSNAERYNGDLDNVTLLGQSAGAHLTMMSLISQAQMCAYEESKQREGPTAAVAPSEVAYNVTRYNPRKCIHQYVGLSGIYDVHHIVRHLDRRGLYRSVLYQIAGGHQNLSRYTVNNYFDPILKNKTGEAVPDNLFEFLPRKMFFLHGDADRSAPVSQSANLVVAMRNAQREAIVTAYHKNPSGSKTAVKPALIEFILIPGATHTDSIIEEPLSCRNSHVVEFLSLYTVNDEERKQALGVHNRGDSTAGLPREVAALVTTEDTEDEDYNSPVKRPDGVLLSPMPSKERPALMRMASFVCPF